MINQLSLSFDRNYGIDRRTGWTVVCNGRIECQLTDFAHAAAMLMRAMLEHGAPPCDCHCPDPPPSSLHVTISGLGKCSECSD